MSGARPVSTEGPSVPLEASDLQLDSNRCGPGPASLFSTRYFSPAGFPDGSVVAVLRSVPVSQMSGLSRGWGAGGPGVQFSRPLPRSCPPGISGCRGSQVNVNFRQTRTHLLA